VFKAVLALSLILLPPFCRAQNAPPPVVVDPYQNALEKLKSADPLVRRQGVELVAQQRDQRAVAALMSALSDPHVFVRSAAIDNLGVMRAPVAARLMEFLNPEKEKEAVVRRSAATALAYLADPVSADALIFALKDSDSGVRYSAVRALGVLRLAKSTEALSGFLSDPDVGMRRTVIAAFGQIRDPASTGVFIKALKDSDVYVRLESVKALAVLPGAEASAGLVSAVSDDDLSVALQAGLALVSQGNKEGLPVALRALKNDKPLLRQQAASLLGVAGDAQALAAVNAAIKAEKDPVTKTLLEAAAKQIKGRSPPAPPAQKKKNP
jgi:HEAT repeat protein